MRRIAGAEADMKNILRIFRLTGYYKLDKTDVLTYLLPFGHKMNAVSLKNLIELEVVKTPYHRVFNGSYDFLESPEAAFNRAMRQICEREARANPQSPAAAAGLIYTLC
jgi:vacuolar-type H+-ATPase subunit C/Vma6